MSVIFRRMECLSSSPRTQTEIGKQLRCDRRRPASETTTARWYGDHKSKHIKRSANSRRSPRFSRRLLDARATSQPLFILLQRDVKRIFRGADRSLGSGRNAPSD
ncbi:hypothetical protein Y032_0093g2662 [Ancylostoma ceylanicum]|uniref:Uncharacterized protein n=1 Tax=Ancylostoma ceylanicum TaxID=53326 RepID=A0A016TM33_9BILA|nr:hypothetical protein Y032_0093g2662 [Ancylostoma ceylanicum]